jgi:hypothetical protein
MALAVYLTLIVSHVAQSCIHLLPSMEHIIKTITKQPNTPATPTALAEVSPQLLGDMRDRVEMIDTGINPSSGIDILDDMKDRLSLEGRELQRMEDEGGLPLLPSQKAKVMHCLKASQRIKTLLRASVRKFHVRKL